MRKKVLLILILLVCGLSVAWTQATANAQSAHARIEYRYMAATGLTELAPLCGFGPCPAVAVASSGGHAVEISGEGTLSISRETGEPKSVTGSGSFIHRNSPAGTIVAIGAWAATKLVSFESFGPSPPAEGLPQTWHAGRARIRVHLVSDDGGMEAIGILEVDCILPGVAVPPDMLEGIKLNVKGGPNFDTPIFSPTLFIRRN